MKSWLYLLLVFLVPFVVAEPCQENQQRQCGTTAVGECSYGIQICQQGQWSVCYGGRDPVAEVCNNGLDDDCDGQTDEDCFCIADSVRDCTGNSQGICRPGYQTCINGTSWSSCVNQTLPLQNEICDNTFDDDCDGQVDENCQQNQTQQTSTCFNDMQDGDETGVDCGGSCRACTSCIDGVLNQGEYKTSVDLGTGNTSDCGGPNCPACPTCSDGIKNQGETAIDCGGPCQTCQKTGEDADEDQDGLTLAVELQQGTDPTRKDTDGDGRDDKQDRYPLCPNLVCDVNYGEDPETCPKDCSAEGSSLSIILIIFFLIILILGGYFYYQFKKTGKILSTSKTQKETSQPIYIDKNLLRSSLSKEQKSKIDNDLEKSFQKVEKLFK